MSAYTLERCRKTHSACMTLAAGAKTPVERNHWIRMEQAWLRKLAELRRTT